MWTAKLTCSKPVRHTPIHPLFIFCCFVGPGKARRVYNLICGVSDNQSPKMTKQQRETQKRELSSIDENPTWSRICDINAVVVLCVACFIIGFYA